MQLGGYADNVAHVDLTSGTIEYKGIPEEWARKYKMCIRDRSRP